MIKIVDHPLAKLYLTKLRDKTTHSSDFRTYAEKLGVFLALKASESLEMETFQINTPIIATQGQKLRNKTLVIPILRAGLVLLKPFEEMIPEAIIGYYGVSRNELSYEPVEYFVSIPKIDHHTEIFVLDPMIATGGSVSSCLGNLQINLANKITVVSMIAAPEGIERILSEFPDIDIITASIDEGLNENKYIIPGLGDAGDRLNGTVS